MTISTSVEAPAPFDRRALKAKAFRRGLLQLAIVAAVIVMLIGLGFAIKNSLAARGIAFSFDYIGAPAGFEISEGLTYSFSDPLGLVSFSSEMTNAQALVAGLVNTIKVAALAIILATLLGVFLGIGRLSTNWVVRQLSFWFVEFVRNTPLLIQLTFWYVAVVLQFPPISQARHFMGVVLAQQGIWLPSVTAADGATATSIVGALASFALLCASLFIKSKARRAACLTVGSLLLVAIWWMGFPLAIEYPEVGKFRASGGLALSPEFTAILIAITVNSSAYLGEVVRGAIENLHKGQWEAAGSLGFSRRDTIRDIVLPQVFRVVLPSFGNQYIGLAKNTSLGIAIGFPDLFNTYGTVANQTGRSLEGVIVVMLVYLLMSLTISVTVNAINDRIAIPGTR